MATRNRRKYHRFALNYHITLGFRAASQSHKLEAITKNVSAGGLLLSAPTRIPEDCLVSFTIMAKEKQAIRPIEFRGKGKVVRVVPEPPGYAIALECVRPIEYHPVTGRNRGSPPFLERP